MEGDAELLTSLLRNTIEIIAKNPSEKLDKKHSTNFPINEMKGLNFDRINPLKK